MPLVSDATVVRKTLRRRAQGNGNGDGMHNPDWREGRITGVNWHKASKLDSAAAMAETMRTLETTITGNAEQTVGGFKAPKAVKHLLTEAMEEEEAAALDAFIEKRYDLNDPSAVLVVQKHWPQYFDRRRAWLAEEIDRGARRDVIYTLPFGAQTRGDATYQFLRETKQLNDRKWLPGLTRELSGLGRTEPADDGVGDVGGYRRGLLASLRNPRVPPRNSSLGQPIAALTQLPFGAGSDTSDDGSMWVVSEAGSTDSGGGASSVWEVSEAGSTHSGGGASGSTANGPAAGEGFDSGDTSDTVIVPRGSSSDPETGGNASSVSHVNKTASGSSTGSVASVLQDRVEEVMADVVEHSVVQRQEEEDAQQIIDAHNDFMAAEDPDAPNVDEARDRISIADPRSAYGKEIARLLGETMGDTAAKEKAIIPTKKKAPPKPTNPKPKLPQTRDNQTGQFKRKSPLTEAERQMVKEIMDIKRQIRARAKARKNTTVRTRLGIAPDAEAQVQPRSHRTGKYKKKSK